MLSISDEPLLGLLLIMSLIECHTLRTLLCYIYKKNLKNLPAKNF